MTLFMLRAALTRLWHRLRRFGHDGPWQEPKWKLK